MIYALMCTRNEAGRYLEDSLAWLLGQVDGVFAYDDRSTDETWNVLNTFRDIGVHPCIRVRGPSFMEHEGQFRTGALRSMEKSFHLTEDDWIFMADADEFYVPYGETLHGLIAAQQPHIGAIRLRIHSVWGQEGRKVYHRVDSAWDTLFEPRLWRWRPDLAFANASMACRNEPMFYTQNHGLVAAPQTGSAILHYGYANLLDRAERFKRYTSLEHHGHSEPFIQSINDTDPYLLPWGGPVPADVR